MLYAQGTALKVRSVMIAPQVSSLSDFGQLTKGSSALLRIVKDGWKFDYFFQAGGDQGLIVFFPAALLKDKRRRVPYFSRWTWASEFSGYDVLCISDPTLHLHPKLLGGWFHGRQDDWVLERCLGHIAEVQRLRGRRNVFFIGASLGGFASLASAILAPKYGISFGQGGLISEIPQISLYKYFALGNMKRLAQVCYRVKDLADVPERFRHRFDLTELIKREGYIPPGRVVVKESDIHHHQVQVHYLLEQGCAGEGTPLEVEVIPAGEDANGHTPLTISEVSDRLLTLTPEKLP